MIKPLSQKYRLQPISATCQGGLLYSFISTSLFFSLYHFLRKKKSFIKSYKVGYPPKVGCKFTRTPLIGKNSSFFNPWLFYTLKDKENDHELLATQKTVQKTKKRENKNNNIDKEEPWHFFINLCKPSLHKQINIAPLFNLRSKTSILQISAKKQPPPFCF